MSRIARLTRRFSWLAHSLLVVALVGGGLSLAPAAASAAPARAAPTGDSSLSTAMAPESGLVNSTWDLGLSTSAAPEFLSFTAGGHALAFQRGSMYVAGADRVLKVEFVGASGVAPLAADLPPSGGPVQPLEKVSYPGLWPGINLIYESVAGGIAKSSYTVEPGANVGDIRLRYNVPVEFDEDGGLNFGFDTGQMRESVPVAWQDIEGKRVPVEVVFRLMEERQVGFAVGPYDVDYALVIDPALTWNTFLGGSGTDWGYGIAVDGSGNVYVVGESDVSWGSPIGGTAGGRDAFAAKLSSSGSLVWNTFLGGSGNDTGYAIAADGSGNVYVAGSSSATWGSPVRSYSGSNDAFAAKLNSDGAQQWNTFLGSASTDVGYGIAVDGSGNVYVAGYSTATWGSPVRSYAGSEDAFAAKLDSSGSLTWNTFLGASGFAKYDRGNGIAVDGSGNVYVAGQSYDTWGSPVRAHYGADNADAFAAKLDSSGSLTWNTFLGGSGSDYGKGIAVDGSGNVYVAGYGDATWGSPLRAFGAGSDAFAAKLDGSGSLTWSTFLGSADSDYGYGIAADGSGNVYIGGESNATWASPVDSYEWFHHSFVAKLSSAGALQWNTFFGGTGRGAALDGSGNVYVVGYSMATWGSPVRAYTSGYDAFAAKVSIATAYADPSGACGGNQPCATTLQSAMDNVVADGEVYLYAGTYPESLSLSRDLTVTLSGNSTLTGSLSLSDGILDTAGYTLTLEGDWTYAGGTFSASSGTVVLGGNEAQRVDGSLTFNHLTIDNSAGVRIVDDTTVDGTLRLVAGPLKFRGDNLTLNGSVVVTAGGLNLPTTVYNGSSAGQQVLAANYGSLTFNDSAKVLPAGGTIGVADTFTPGAGAGHTIASSTVEFNGRLNSQSVPAGFTFNNLTLNNPSGATASGDLSVAGQLEVMTGTFTARGSVADVQVDSGAMLALASEGSLAVGGNWANNGSFTHNNASVTFNKNGTTIFDKAGAGSTETFCNITISSGTTVDTGDDYLTTYSPAGCWATNEGAVIRNAPAQYADTEQPVTYVDGLGMKSAILTSQGTTPLGSTAVTVRAGEEPPLCNGNPFPTMAMKRWYDIQPEITSEVLATMRLYFSMFEMNGVAPLDASIYHCGASGGWELPSGTQTRGMDPDGYYVEVSDVSEFSPFGFGDGAPTAVTVSSLDAGSLGSGVEVRWETGMELEVMGFNVWRAASGDGGSTRLNGAMIPARGSGGLGNSYTYVDLTAVPGRRYEYRLEVVDFRGGSEWYGPVEVTVWQWRLFLPWILK